MQYVRRLRWAASMILPWVRWADTAWSPAPVAVPPCPSSNHIGGGATGLTLSSLSRHCLKSCACSCPSLPVVQPHRWWRHWSYLEFVEPTLLEVLLVSVPLFPSSSHIGGGGATGLTLSSLSRHCLKSCACSCPSLPIVQPHRWWRHWSYLEFVEPTLLDVLRL